MKRWKNKVWQAVPRLGGITLLIAVVATIFACGGSSGGGSGDGGGDGDSTVNCNWSEENPLVPVFVDWWETEEPLDHIIAPEHCEWQDLPAAQQAFTWCCAEYTEQKPGELRKWTIVFQFDGNDWAIDHVIEDVAECKEACLD